MRSSDNNNDNVLHLSSVGEDCSKQTSNSTSERLHAGIANLSRLLLLTDHLTEHTVMVCVCVCSRERANAVLVVCQLALSRDSNTSNNGNSGNSRLSTHATRHRGVDTALPHHHGLQSK